MISYRFRLAIVLLLALTLPSADRVFGSEASPIKHIIVIMQENHSFDNYFGTYPTANGTLVNSITSQLQRVDGFPQGVCLPIDASCVPPHYSNASNTMNPVEGQVTYEQDYASGKMNGFATFSGPQSMAYFDYHQIASYWDYAEEYGLADRYFASALTTTTPNRLLLLAGDSPVANNYGPPPYVAYNQTILGELAANGLSWGYFDFLNAFGSPNNVYPLNYTADLNATSASHIEDISALFQYLRTGAGLPAVSFVNALGSVVLDEHPPENVTEGELWVVSVVNALMSSIYWNSSVIMIAWDEGGGYYDHVAPPQLLRIDHGFDHPLMGYGQRVPLLVISAYSKENYVSETVLNHMSILRFIDYNWNLLPLNQNIVNSNNLLEFFDFASPARAPVVLGETGQFSSAVYPIPMQIPLSQLKYSRTAVQTRVTNPLSLSTQVFVPILVTVFGVTLLIAVKKRLVSR